MAQHRETLTCDEHGTAYTTFVCEHLLENPAQEWFSAVPSEENRWPDALCSRCNIEFLKEGEWNERNEATIKIKLLCDSCYVRARAKGTFNPDT